METVLGVSGLTVRIENRGRVFDAVSDVSLEVRRGETFALVGESGSGKSVTCYSLMGLVPQPPGRIESGTALFDGVDSHPLLSRCIKFELKVEDCAAQIVERAKAIAEAEGLGGADLAEYMLLAKRCKFNFRDMLTEIERGEMFVELAPQIVTARFGDGQSYDSAAIERMLMRS